MARIDAIFEAVQAQGASDLHISTGAPPMVRRNGEMEAIPFQELTRELAELLLLEIMGDKERGELAERRHVDFSYDVGRFRVRCNVYEENRGLAGAFRLMPSSILTLEQLGLAEHLGEFASARRGLVLVTGPPGSGKSTTLAALVDHLNQRERRHIITIEDPIEYIHQNRRCLIHQREVGRHTNSFADALHAALREDPDTLLVGEMRDRETMALAVTAAQTGQLVLGTLHTTSAAETIERVIDMFPADLQSQARGALASSLRAVVSQRLVKRADGRGRVAAVEILVGTPAVSALIREKKIHQIPSVIQTGRREGMILLDDALQSLVSDGVVALEDAQAIAGVRLVPRPGDGQRHSEPLVVPPAARGGASPNGHVAAGARVVPGTRPAR